MRKQLLGSVVEFDRLLGFVIGFDFTGWRLVIRCTISYASLTQLWLGTHYLSIWR